jgi:multiple antibiotic resistance protein
VVLWSDPRPGRPPTPMIDTFFLVKSFVTLLVITDPVGTVPIFLAITADWGARERNRAAWQAVAVAASVIATFALFGQQILTYLGISLPSLQVAGGLLLLVIALDLLRGETESMSGVTRSNVAFVPLGTPLLAGPGAIAAIMVFMRQAEHGDQRLGVALGLLGVLAVLYLSLRFAGLLQRILRQAGIDLITRISGLLLAAIAVQLVVDAVREFVRADL